MKKPTLKLAAVILVLSLFASAAFAAANPERPIAAHERMLEIERALVKYEQGYGYAPSHRYSGYSVDENGTPTYYYPKNVSRSTVKKTLKDLGFNTSGIKFVAVEYSLYDLSVVMAGMQKALDKQAASLKSAPPRVLPAIEFIPEENKIAAYGVPEGEASRKAFLALFGWDDEGGMLIYKDLEELRTRSYRAVALLPKAVIESEKFRGLNISQMYARPTIDLTDTEDAELRKMIPMFFDVRKRTEEAPNKFYSIASDTPDTVAANRARRCGYFFTRQMYYKTMVFGDGVDLPVTSLPIYSSEINKVRVGVPVLTDELRQRYEEAIGYTEYIELEASR